MIQPWPGVPTVFVIAEIECASTKGARNALRGQLGFALLMGAVVVVRFLAATRALATNSFVRPTAVARGASLTVAESRQLEVPVCARLMAGAAGVQWRDATSLPNRRQNFASNTEVARSVLLLGAIKYLVDVLNSVQR